jgi:hypothetical protein
MDRVVALEAVAAQDGGDGGDGRGRFARWAAAYVPGWARA